MLSIENIGNIDDIRSNRSKGRWFLLKLNSVKQYAKKKARAIEEKLFTHKAVKGLLEKANFSLLELLFGTVSPDRFESNMELIKERWPSWPNKAGYYGFKVVEEVSQDAAFELAKGHLESPFGLNDFEKSTAVTQFISSKDMDGMDTLTEQFLERVKEVPNPFLKEIYERIAFTVALSTGTESGNKVFEKLIKEGIEKKNLGNILGDVYYYGTTGLPFYESLREGRVSTGLFCGLAELFHEHAPLEFFDQARSLHGEELYKRAVELWDELSFPNKYPLSDVLDHEKGGWKKLVGRSRYKKEFGLFLTAVMLHCFLKKEHDFEHYSTSKLFKAATLPFEDVPWLMELEKELGRRDPKEVSEKFSELLQAGLPALSKVLPVKLAGRLGLPGVASLLLDALAENTGNDLSFALGEALVSLDSEAVKALTEGWDNLHYKQRLYGLEVLQRLSYPELFTYLVKSWDEMRDTQLKIWCQAAQMSADERVVEFLEERFSQDVALLDIGVLRETYTFLTELLELDRPFQKETLLPHEQKFSEASAPEGDGLVLELKCPRCGELSNYRVPVLIVSMGFHLDHPLVGGDLQCHFCGAHPQFQITQQGFGKYIEEFGRVSSLMSQGEEPDSPIQFVEPFLVKGARLSIPQALTYFKERVEKNPNEPRHQLYLGHIYQKAKVNSRAIEHFGRAIALDPTNIEAPFFLAMIMEELGRSKEAFEALMALMVFRNRWSYYIFKKRDRRELGESISSLYNWLLRKLSIREMEPLSADFLMHQKIGKNDRCPCGSGKKYKVCCLKKGIY